ncbi:hypothetical protein DL98DRAFT_600723 [Cadophora sp. DSE1049]|nr:hypothetical protein DL98DRAFT_600723 [Cadophora sp. DSE1049]
MELRKCQHENLLAILEVYRFRGVFFVITDYTAATLKQVIAIPLPLEELHVSATCRQVFEGMQHLSRFGMENVKTNKEQKYKEFFVGAGVGSWEEEVGLG